MKYQRNAVEVEAIQYIGDNVADVVNLLSSFKIDFTLNGSSIQLPGMLAPQVAQVNNWIVVQAGLPIVCTTEDFVVQFTKVQEQPNIFVDDLYIIPLGNVAYVRMEAGGSGNGYVVFNGAATEIYMQATTMAAFKQHYKEYLEL